MAAECKNPLHGIRPLTPHLDKIVKENKKQQKQVNLINQFKSEIMHQQKNVLPFTDVDKAEKKEETVILAFFFKFCMWQLGNMCVFHIFHCGFAELEIA